MNELQELERQHLLGRAKNAVQSFLVRKLLIPKVYLDANWNGWPLDILAIDRAGSGDVHGVRLVPWEPGHLDNHGYSHRLNTVLSTALTDFTEFPGHFRYLAIICLEPNKLPWKLDKGIANQSLAADGVGRVGILYVDLSEDDPDVQVILKAERFRSSKELIELTDQFVAANTANWEVRE